MKINKILSLIMVCVLFCCTFTVANADASIDDGSHIHTHNEINFIFENGISEDIKNKIISDFTGSDEPSAEARGLTCTLFGHKLDTGRTTTVTHKKNATAPRCLKETFNYEICSRCDYSNYTLIMSEYINCCS